MPRPYCSTYGYDLTAESDRYGFIQALGATVAVRAGTNEWPRCLSCDSTHCAHMKEFYDRAGIKMTDAVIEDRPPD